MGSQDTTKSETKPSEEIVTTTELPSEIKKSHPADMERSKFIEID